MSIYNLRSSPQFKSILYILKNLDTFYGQKENDLLLMVSPLLSCKGYPKQLYSHITLN